MFIASFACFEVELNIIFVRFTWWRCYWKCIRTIWSSPRCRPRRPVARGCWTIR